MKRNPIIMLRASRPHGYNRGMDRRSKAKVTFSSCVILGLALVFLAIGESPPSATESVLGWIGWALCVAGLLTFTIWKLWK